MNQPNNCFFSMPRSETGNITHTFNVNLIFLKYNKHTITQRKRLKFNLEGSFRNKHKYDFFASNWGGGQRY